MAHSASNTAPVPPAAQPVISRDMWDDTSVELNNQRLKKTIPKLPVIAEELQCVRGKGVEHLAYLALQCAKSNDKKVIMRALASTCNCLFNDGINFTGSNSKVVELTGLDVAANADTPGDTVLTTNFEDAEDVTVAELLTLMDSDPDEIGAYIGVLFYAGNKKVNAQNRSAFNERRAGAATASIVGDPKIFIPDSTLLSDDVLSRMYAAFNSCAPLRSHITSRVVMHLTDSLMGPALSFVNLFLLLADSGMNALRIIKEAVIKHPWIRTDFPELKPELHAANEAQNILRRADGRERSFLKAIHGNGFVPVNYSQIDNLTGVCKEVLKRTTPSYQNYAGGKVTESQLQRINSHTDVATTLVNTVAAE